MVESDYVGESASGFASGSASIPIPLDKIPANGPPYRYLGRTVPLEQWNSTQNATDKHWSDYYGSPLTILGYGDPAFASFYPNCPNVFGLCDTAMAGTTSGLTYHVFGWYSDNAIDPVYQYVASTTPGSTEDLITETPMKALIWITNNHWMNLLVSFILVGTSGQEVWADLKGDLASVSVGAHHGVFIFGIFHIFKTLPDLFGSLQGVEDNVAKVEGK